MDPPFKRTPPKGSDRIRARLESVQREAGQQVQPGPDRDGLSPDTRVVIAAFHTADGGRRFQELLLREGIMSQAVLHRDGAEISVDHSDCQRTAELLEKHLKQYPDLAPKTFRRDFDFTIFGTLLGATFGAILLVGELRELRQLLVLFGFALLGAISGHFVDRPRNRYRQTGRMQFGIGELLLLTTVIALGIVLVRLLSGG